MYHASAEHPVHALAEAGIPARTVRAQPGLVIGEMAGRDSVAALVALTRQRAGEVNAILPTIVATGTEYGDPDEPIRAIHILRTLVAGSVRVYDPVHLASPTLWAALNGRWSAELMRRYGPSAWSPCSACHLYVHLCRVPLAWTLGVTTVSTGERDAHCGRLKFSQLPRTIDASVDAMRYAGLELAEPIRDVDDDASIQELVSGTWDDDAEPWCCLLSGNYIGVDGTVDYDEAAHRRYLDEFFSPVARAVIDTWRDAEIGLSEDAALPDYLAITKAVLERGADS
jgi:hypothetical protein